MRTERKKEPTTIVISLPMVDTARTYWSRIRTARVDWSLPNKLRESVNYLKSQILAAKARPENKVARVSRWLPAGIVGLVILGAAIGGMRIFQGGTTKDSSQAVNSSDSRVELKGARVKTDVNKEFSFPIKDQYGNKVTAVKYYLGSAELRDEIIVKGSKYDAIKGRTFFILTVKLTNDYDKTLNLNARDFIRLTVNGREEEKLAADIHNDPVEVQAISTKETRLGWPVNDSDKDLILWVGEISGNKEKVPLVFKI